jgi:hypothetical protein
MVTPQNYKKIAISARDRIFSMAARIFTIRDRVLGIGYRVLSIFGK